MRVSWMERITNVWVFGNIKPAWTLQSRVAQTAYFGHVAREERGVENDVMLGVMSGKRRRGRPRPRWLDNVMLGEMSGMRRRGMSRRRWLDNVTLGEMSGKRRRGMSITR